jgi:hypothetical protein
VVTRAPAWARLHPDLLNSPPSVAGRDAYARFLTALVQRYGPRGAFWDTHAYLPKVPIRQWQVWNEPDGVRDWSDQPGVADYVQLLKPAYRAIKAADPSGRVVLAAMVGRSWRDLQTVYDAGGRRYFDAAAINPFSLYVRNVVLILRYGRRTMDRNHDRRKPIIVSELSWPSAKGRTDRRYGFEMTERGQAQRVRAALPEIARLRRGLRLIGVYWSSWMSYDRDPTYSFDYAGLRRFSDGRVIAKPAFSAYRSVVRRLER